MANPRDIRFDQRNATNTAYIETYVSGSNLIVRTNDVGVVVGASTIEGIPIGTLISSSGNFTNLSASDISTSNIIVNDNITSNTLFVGTISASGRISSSNINVGTPNSSYPWGNSMTGSYFSSWTSDTNVSDALRFFAGAFSSSFPIPTPNTILAIVLNEKLKHNK